MILSLEIVYTKNVILEQLKILSYTNDYSHMQLVALNDHQKYVDLGLLHPMLMIVRVTLVHSLSKVE